MLQEEFKISDEELFVLKISFKKLLVEIARIRSYSGLKLLLKKIVRRFKIVLRGFYPTAMNQKVVDYYSRKKNFKVSVIIPSYNHREFLQERLDSIFSQTYKNIEVIILDDASSDCSHEFVIRYIQEKGLNVKLIRNSINSGSGYKQWAKGIEKASGDLIWIAESDDFSSPFFLEELVPAFHNSAVMLAFCNSSMFSDKTSKEVSSMKSFCFGKTNMNSEENFLLSCAEFLANGFDSSNLIPNVSSCVFRRPSNAVLNGSWRDMKIAGDWLFYVMCALGGLVFHSKKTLNYYRLHQNSTVAQNRYQQVFLSEVEEVRKVIATLESKLCVLIVVPGFVLGGAEAMALRIATVLWNLGINVAILNLRLLPEDSDAIPIYPLPPVYEPRNFQIFLNNCHLEFSIVHTHHAVSDVLVAQELNANAQHVVSLHGMYEQMDLQSIQDAVEKLQRSEPTFTYLNSKNLDKFPKSFRESHRFFLVSNFVYDQQNTESQEILRSNDDVNCVLISRAIKGKGWELAIEAISIARHNSGRDIHLYLVGSGPEYERLTRLRLDHWVHLTGATNDPLSFAKNMDIGLFLSDYPGESSPLVLMEYLTVGIPVVFMNIGNSRALMSDELGLIGFEVETHFSAREVASEVERALGLNSDEIDNIKCRSLTKAKSFSSEAVIEQYLQIYHKVLGLEFSS